MIRIFGLPQHSPLGLLIDVVWSVAFLGCLPWVFQALTEAQGDDKYRQLRKINGRIRIEARRAIRTEAFRLGIASLYALLGIWALFTPELQPLTPRGSVTLVMFIVIGLLTIGQTVFDRHDRREQMRLLVMERARETSTENAT